MDIRSRLHFGLPPRNRASRDVAKTLTAAPAVLLLSEMKFSSSTRRLTSRFEVVRRGHGQLALGPEGVEVTLGDPARPEVRLIVRVLPKAERAEIRILIRDFEEAGMERRRALVHDIAGRIQADNPKSRVTVEIKESYRNMLRYIEEKDRRVIDVALAAGRAMGFEPELEPVRGGTDGARLSERGIPTPNIFTGGHDFHSRFEWNSVQNLERALAYVKQVLREWGALES